MKNLIIILFIVNSAFGWEINTHRAIDRKAIENSKNLKTFVKNSGIQNIGYSEEKFEGYGNYTYLNYVENGELNGISTEDWKQKFNSSRPSYQKLIEAGSILEDAQWQDADFKGDGRFNNHFYEAQNGGHELTYGYGFHVNAVDWVTDVKKGEKI